MTNLDLFSFSEQDVFVASIICNSVNFINFEVKYNAKFALNLRYNQ